MKNEWRGFRVGLRRFAAALTPKVVTIFPSEVIVCLIALLTGLPFLLGVAPPLSLITLVGQVPFTAWAAALTLGGSTVGLGLLIPNYPSPRVVASGLSLVAGCFAVNAIAVVVVLGSSGLPVLAAYACLALVSMVRATHFRRVVDIQKEARRLQKKGGDDG